MSRAIRYRLVFVFCALTILAAFYVLYSVVNTLSQLDGVERERDRWQRPDDILRALDVRPGSRVVDLGSGAGYFSLKLAPFVGGSGHVIAVDLRKVSLFFLKLRIMLRGYGNVQLVTGDVDDPHLPPDSADAVLICNTYHELSNRQLTLGHVFRALRSGGRVVVADREPAESSSNRHEITLAEANADLERIGFHTTRKDPALLTDPGGEVWWLMVAVKP
jgi:ubiquinone/menaquinone biosynthesis C-methylase UbiE